ncbi:MAG: hypothetical protein EZS28_045260 [Streblomastix strix]|uniref:Reverse transcriptase domain-containing protein n=1 Tax=Streblomastix strix TaxID=222440 RepID=A0A5J4TLE4_9EUKA|nr:MAG: hypothetical protein EZS28_045260 [Streblomastix strix]
MKIEIKIINYVDGIYLLHWNKDYMKNMIQYVIDTLKYFEFTINSEKSETEPQQMDKDRIRENSKTESQISKKAKLFKTTIQKKFTLPEHNEPTESISCMTERMEYIDDNEDDCNTRYKFVDCKIQSKHSSTINIDTTTNDNDNRCSTQWMWFNVREGSGKDSNSS